MSDYQMMTRVGKLGGTKNAGRTTVWFPLYLLSIFFTLFLTGSIAVLLTERIN